MKDGFASLATPEDLLKKLEHDRERIRANGSDAFAAFDFFVTAEHLLDWILPDEPGVSRRKERTIRRENERLLRIASHIASGAKHFRTTAHHHSSVENVKEGIGLRTFNLRTFTLLRATRLRSLYMPGLFVQLDDGSVVSVAQLAEELLAFWKAELGGT